MRVASIFMARTGSEKIESEGERTEDTDAAGCSDHHGVHLALPAGELAEQQPKSAREVSRQQENERNLGDLHPRLSRPRKEAVQAGLAVERLRQHGEMEGQKHEQGDARKP